MAVDEALVSPQDGENQAGLFSPGFRSVAAMAGWDEESILLATQVVEDTPDRESKLKTRSDLVHFKTPPTHSRRKRRIQRTTPVSMPVTVLDLDEDETKQAENETKKTEEKVEETKKTEEKVEDSTDVPSSSSPSILCIDRLREELSCAICLEICFEPSTTPCGHSFCKKCLRSAADKCGKKCPKCRQLISNGRSCNVNTVLWNTIQLLFPKEVEARKTDKALAKQQPEPQQHEISVPQRASRYNARDGTVLALNSPESEGRGSGTTRQGRRRRGVVVRQDEDTALALRLQRAEFMEAFGRHRNPLTSARENLRAMAMRAQDIRVRGRL